MILVPMYSGTCMTSTHWGMQNSAGLAGCRIIEVNLYGKTLMVGARDLGQSK